MGKKLEEQQGKLGIDPKIARWFAVYTKYKSEKSVKQSLQKKGIEAYVPLNRVIRQYQRKRKTVELPLINCYCFVKISKEQYVKVLETVNVLNFVKFNRELVSIPENEMEILKKVSDHFYDIDTLNDFEFAPGMEVEVIGGALTGLKGVLLKNRGKNFLVQLEGIGIGLQIQVEEHMLKPLRPSLRI